MPKNELEKSRSPHQEFPNQNPKEFATDDKAEIGRSILQLLNASNELFHLVHRGSAYKHQQLTVDTLAFEMPSSQSFEFVTNVD